MVRAIPFGKLQKIWAMIWGDADFLIFLVCSADLDIPCSGAFSYNHVKFYSFMFMRKISTRVFLKRESAALSYFKVDFHCWAFLPPYER